MTDTDLESRTDLEPNTEFDELHDPAAGTVTIGTHVNPGLRAYGFCSRGVVRALKAVASLRHPFGNAEMHIMGQAKDPQRDHVIDVTGTICHVGYLVDNKGNVTPPGTRAEPLTVYEPAYHETHAPTPIPTSEQAEILGRPGTDAPAEAPSPAMTDARIEARGEGDQAHLPAGHENDHGVQEHHDHPVHDGEHDETHEV